MDDKKFRTCRQVLSDRQNKYQQPLRTGEYKMGETDSQCGKQKKCRIDKMGTKQMAVFKKYDSSKIIERDDKRRDNFGGCGCCENEKKKLEINTSKARVYDILESGRNNRFTVSNCLVHNCGYQGGVGALKAMGAEMCEEEMQQLVSAWRKANPNIVKLWYAVENAAIKAVKEKTTVNVGKINFVYESGILFIALPSGRRLSYIKPRLELDERFNKEVLTYEGTQQKNWGRLNTYGGKITENVVQATARDILAEAMLSLDKAGYKIVMHCHDEVIIEAPVGQGSLKEVCDIMGITPKWAEGLPLKAEGYECKYYKKE